MLTALVQFEAVNDIYLYKIPLTWICSYFLFTMGKLLHVYTVFNFLLRFLLLLFTFFKASGMSMA